MPITIARVPVLSDNYVWLVHDDASGETAVVDPAVAAPVLDAATQRGWAITQIWNTHWHPDHTGGNAEIKAAVEQAGGQCTITGPAAEAARIPTLDRHVGEGDVAMLGAHRAAILSVPAHTAGHIAYHLDGAQAAFVGDTLFAMGCGRLFEGTAQQMFTNMQRLAALPAETAVYCAHEYTLSNARWAVTAEPDNAALADRLAMVTAQRERGEATVPTSIGAERATNPFMRAVDADHLARLRAAKDAF
ncbi:MAG: hydroxyacylglutathione hydrolase [Sphingopyxis sp.]